MAASSIQTPVQCNALVTACGIIMILASAFLLATGKSDHGITLNLIAVAILSFDRARAQVAARRN